MRAPAIALLLLVSAMIPLVPTAAAAEATLSDATGDVQVETGAAGAPLAAPSGAGASVDLTGLVIDEAEDTLTLTLGVASLEDAADATGEYFIDFTWGRMHYTAYAARYTFVGGAVYAYGFLAVRDDAEPSRDSWNLEMVAPLQPVFDAAARTVTLTIPKAYLLDKAERPPIKGEPLEGISAHAERRFLGIGFTIQDSRPLAMSDTMPDDGGVGTYVFQKGDEAKGDVLLRSYDRVRVSNGGATTFVFQAIVQNKGEMDHEFQMSLVDLPEGWTGKVDERVIVPAKSEIWIPVLATVPFEHNHGGYTSFGLKAVSTRDAGSTALLRLGVLHTPIPQPAGHHNELCLHAPRGNSENVFRTFWPDTQLGMNTVCEHEAEAPEVPTMWRDSDGHKWMIPLRPALKMGLDFDVEKTGALVGSLVGRTAGEGTVSAQLLLVPSNEEGGWYSPDDGLLLAESDKQTIELDLQKPSDFSLVLTPTPEADYIPYTPGQNLLLVVTLDPESVSTSCCMAQTQPALTTADFRMTLPLNEYHDRLVSEEQMLGSALRLVAKGEVQKLARPGATATYAFTLTNAGEREIVVELDVAGTHAAQGALAPSGEVTLAPGASRELTLGVRVSPEAAADELVEVLVFAHAVDDPSLAAVARTITRVSLGADAGPDESGVFAAAQEEQNDTPGAGALLVLAAVGAAALAWGRRRKL